MTLNVPINKSDEQYTYAQYLRNEFKNSLIQDVLMKSEVTYKNQVITFDIINPSSEFIKDLKYEYPELILI